MFGWGGRPVFGTADVVFARQMHDQVRGEGRARRKGDDKMYDGQLPRPSGKPSAGRDATKSIQIPFHFDILPPACHTPSMTPIPSSPLQQRFHEMVIRTQRAVLRDRTCY